MEVGTWRIKSVHHQFRGMTSIYHEMLSWMMSRNSLHPRILHLFGKLLSRFRRNKKQLKKSFFKILTYPEGYTFGRFPRFISRFFRRLFHSVIAWNVHPDVSKSDDCLQEEMENSVRRENRKKHPTRPNLSRRWPSGKPGCEGARSLLTQGLTCLMDYRFD